MSSDRIVVEFSYWLYGRYFRNAMVRRPEVNNLDIEEISKKYAVKAQIRYTKSTYYSIGRPPRRYRKAIITVYSEYPDEIRGFLREIVLLYGHPDEIPLAFTMNKRAGRAILKAMLKEYPKR
ncbi:MAG: hypothetical protein QXI32_01140 [Candidatus Bathyarchaeia archaeon]